MPRQISRRGVERPADFADFLRHQRFVCYRPYPQRQFGLASGEVDRLQAAQEIEGSARMFAAQLGQQLRQMRGEERREPGRYGNANRYGLGGSAAFQFLDRSLDLLRVADQGLAQWCQSNAGFRGITSAAPMARSNASSRRPTVGCLTPSSRAAPARVPARAAARK